MSDVHAFAFLVSHCASGLLKELVEEGKTEAQARNAIVHYFLDFASGEACRLARSQGREPNRDNWLKAVNGAFAKAVVRTDKGSARTGVAVRGDGANLDGGIS